MILTRGHRTVISAILIILFLSLCPAVYAEEKDDWEAELEALLKGEEEVELYEFPVIAPEYSLELGYRFVSLDGPDSVGRYEYHESSVAAGGEARIFKFPHRFYLFFDVLSTEDTFADLRYAHGEGLLLRVVSAKLHHNYEYLPLRDLDTSSASPGVSLNDCGDKCDASTLMNHIALRLKYPGYPAHLFMNFDMLQREGDRQKRFIGGSGYFNEIIRTSESRDLASSSSMYEAGANAHLGPVEAQLSFTSQSFTPDSEVSYHSYSANSIWNSAGTYPHNLVPELSSKSQSFKVHTSFTGRIVASASLTAREMKNDTSGAKADYVLGAASVAWMPVRSVFLVMRYSHKDLEAENPPTAVITDTSGAVTYTRNANPLISYKKDDVKVTGRFRVSRNITVTGRYEMERTERENAADWGLSSDATTKNTYGLDAKGRIGRSLILKAVYNHITVEDPAYNSEPDNMDKVSASASWSPTGSLHASVGYAVSKGERSSLVYNGVTNARDRETSAEQANAAVTFLLGEDVTLTGGYFFIRNFIKQDLVYGDPSGTPLISPGVVQYDKSQGYTLDLSYVVNERLALSGGLSYTINKAALETNNQDFLQPISIASLSDFKTTETAFNVAGDLGISDASSVSVDYRYKKLNEELDNPNDGLDDGELQIVMVSYKRKW